MKAALSTHSLTADEIGTVMDRRPPPEPVHPLLQTMPLSVQLLVDGHCDEESALTRRNSATEAAGWLKEVRHLCACVRVCVLQL
jgi:hypothetical protein